MMTNSRFTAVDLRSLRFNPWLIALTVMLATFMELLDASVVNIALRHIAGTFASGPDEATWVLTSYLIANAIVLLATGWLSAFFGRKRLMLASIVIFTVASMLCGVAPSLPFLILARVVQGIGGGVLQPSAQAVLLESFPPAKRGHGMCLYTIGIMVAPLLGPSVGGWITENWSWRAAFYINLPVGILALLMTQIFVTDPPYLQPVRRRVDYVGFALMVVGLGALQIALDRGQQADWLSSALIRNLIIVAALMLGGFIWWQLRVKNPIVDLRVLKDRNFAIGTLLVTFVSGVVFYATVTLLPMFLESLMGYTSALSGQTLAARGIGALIATIFVGRLIGKIDLRLISGCGIGLLALSIYLLSVVNLEVAQSAFWWPCFWNGVAFGFISAPLMALAVSTIRNDKIGYATSIFNALRNLGGSVGISVLTTLLARREQSNQTILGPNFTSYNPAFRGQIQRLQATLGRQRAYRVLYENLLTQASLLAFIDQFRTLAIFCLLCAPLALFFRKTEYREGDLSRR